MQFLAAGGVTTPLGYRAAATACGLKESGELDLTLVASDQECSGAGVFTQNQIVAAPVTVDREVLQADPERLRGVLANAGVANACTGSPGLETARSMQALAARSLACRPDQILLLSTGVIGVPVDLGKVEFGLRQLANGFSSDGGAAAARAIMTTDTRPKQAAVQLEFPDGEVRLGGMAKGAGMIHPDMATMLALITTDAKIASQDLNVMLRSAVDRSFNRITVDGDTSTNDTVLLLANGESGVRLQEAPALEQFSAGLDSICSQLAQEIVRDAEGASKFVDLTVGGAPDEEAALCIANTIATSPLVKTALAGGDPNWGRILAAAGRAGVELEAHRLALWVGGGGEQGLQLVRDGVSTGYKQDEAEQILAGPELTIVLDLGLGGASATVWTSDLTHDYVTLNAEYRT